MSEINIPEIWKKNVVRPIKGPPCPACNAELFYKLTGPNFSWFGAGGTVCPKCGWDSQSLQGKVNNDG